MNIKLGKVRLMRDTNTEIRENYVIGDVER